MTETKPIVSVENVVASASVDEKIDLNDITKKFPDTEYHPDQFPGLVFRLESPRTATLIFRTGKMVCTGAKSEEMAVKARTVIAKPRTCTRQTLRANVASECPEEYWRRSVYVPFLDSLRMQLGDRFSCFQKIATMALNLLPQGLNGMTEEKYKLIQKHFKQDLPEPSEFHIELDRWKLFWKLNVGNEAPKTISETIESTSQIKQRFPNIYTILHILLVTPITAASAERANSSLKHVMTPKRSTMREDRLNALVLMYVHRDIKIDTDRIVDMYATSNASRMLLINPFEEM